MKDASKNSWLLILRKLGLASSLGGRLTALQAVFRRIFRRSTRTLLVRDFDGDFEMALRLSEHMQRRIFWMGYYNRDIVSYLDQALKPGMAVLDIGANIGEISLVAARRVGPKGRVISFEPIDAIADVLERNVVRNKLNNVSVARLALSDAVGVFPVYHHVEDPSDDNGGLGTLFGATGEDVIQHVSATTLDEFVKSVDLPGIDLIKIDIEGAELPCLRGGEQTISRFRPIIIVEVQEKSASAAGYKQIDILSFLAGFGYTFHNIGRRGRLSSLNKDMLLEYQNVACLPRRL